MALSAELEKVLSYIPDVTEREARRKQLTELEESGLRQSEFSRKMNELTEQERSRKAAYDEGRKWVEENRTFYKEAIGQRNAYEARVKELEAQINKNKTPEIEINGIEDPQIAAQLRAAREAAALAQQQVTEQSQRLARIDEMLQKGELVTKDQLEKTALQFMDGFSKAQFGVLDAQARAVREFGKEINRDDLLKESEKFQGNLDMAYKSITEPMRIEKMREDMRKELQTEFDTKLRNANIPVSAAPAPVEMGALQSRVNMVKDAQPTIDPNITIQNRSALAFAIGQELRNEGKF